MVETQGPAHINLQVADVHRAKASYERVFGLQELFWDGPGMVFLRPPGPHDTFTLQQAPKASREASNIDHFGLRLVDQRQLDRAIEEVLAAGGTLLERGEHQPGSPYAYVTDPDGHVIEL
jgi:catechol 2,3-dioxygenase-like lactoylglutathione lyase family enzyme